MVPAHLLWSALECDSRFYAFCWFVPLLFPHVRGRCQYCLGYLLHGREPWVPVPGLRVIDGIDMPAGLARPSVMDVRMALAVVVTSFVSGVDFPFLAPLSFLVGSAVR